LRTFLHWFRRDLRVEDNTALFQAARDADRVVPVFILDDTYLNDPNVGPSRFRFLRESLEELAAALEKIGGRLLLRPGPASLALPELLAETGAAGVYANAEIGPYPERRDAGARAAVENAGGRFRLFPDALLVEPDALATASGDPYTAYTAFAKKWLATEKHDPLPRPADLATPALRSVPLEKPRAWRNLAGESLSPRGGATAARALLNAFFRGPAARYAADRDLPHRTGTSRLSPHLHFGTISPRTIRAAAEEAFLAAPLAGRAGIRKFVAELAWREFYHHVLFHFPHVADESFQVRFDRLAWRDDPAALDAWKRGATGYPLVDAAMRALAATHWMHNRGRMVAASFLTKDLHVHWKHGEKWFEHQLADADLANNNGGWQWAAGTGTDAAPYFRIFNPVLQSRKLDPQGLYIRRFVPALARVPADKIHAPWTMTGEEQRAAGCVIGRDYPAPIVDHAREREVALRLLEEARG
jgi:deoxyribodipyrimidine photo-lyase